MLVAILLLSIVVGAQADRLGSICEPVKEVPTEVGFMASSDDTAAVEMDSYIHFLVDKTYLPLKIQSVEHNGVLSHASNSTLVIETDCASIEIDLTVTNYEAEYKGQSTEVRVTYRGITYRIRDRFVRFSKHFVNISHGYSYNCVWVNLDMDYSFRTEMKLEFSQFRFVVESTDVTNKYKKRSMNDVGYQSGF